MKLSKECIEAIEKAVDNYPLRAKFSYGKGIKEALTNPSIYEKAGLISLEDAFEFLRWTREKAWGVQNQDRYLYQLKWYTTAQLFQIYQEQKEK